MLLKMVNLFYFLRLNEKEGENKGEKEKEEENEEDKEGKIRYIKFGCKNINIKKNYPLLSGNEEEKN